MSYFKVDVGDDYEYVQADLVSWSTDGKTLHFQRYSDGTPRVYEICAAFRRWSNFQQITEDEYTEANAA